MSRRARLPSLLVCFIIALCIVVSPPSHATAAAPPFQWTPKYDRAAQAALEGEHELKECRAKSTNETLRDLECLDASIRTFPYNASWYKQVSALATITGLDRRAYDAANFSLYVVLSARG
jgi:hypothetical protein